MAITERIYRRTDQPMSWAKAIVLGSIVWILGIVLLGQLPSLIIYYADQYIAEIIDFTTNIPGVNAEGLNPKQVAIARDIVANSVQMGILTMALVAAYIWQERKRKRTGTKGHTDTVKGYMSGK
ncbi:MAG: hypothetical protein H0U17_09555 [Actinobacteria bacterium]|jgi:hypothetical protein|nr:hypothetical protein [Actinomycetota bacterium]